MKDPYATLGVPKDASDSDVRRAFRRLAKQYHPDATRNDPKAAERFREISAAYELLSDREKRARFDRGEIDAEGRERGFEAGFGGWSNTGGSGPGFSPEDLFSEIFESFGGRGGARGGGPFGARGFAGGSAGARRKRGADVTMQIPVPFLEAARGGSRRVRTPSGRNIDVRIPIGTQDGTVLRLQGQGETGQGGGPSGDLMIEIRVEPHPDFRREGADIHVDLPIGLRTAVLGGRVEVPTIDGPVTMTVPAGSNTGTVLRLRGRGIGHAGDRDRGDQFVRLQIVLDDPRDPELRRFVEDMPDEGETQNRARAGTGEE